MTTTIAGQPGALRVCLLVLGGEVFAVDVRCAREVVVLDELTVVPQAPSYVVGVANVRGHVVPIVDVRPLLGLPSRRVEPGTRAMVLETAPLQAAVLTEGVLGLAAFDEVIPVGDARPQQRSSFAIGVLRRDQGPAMLLDVSRMLEALRTRAPGPRTGGAPTPAPAPSKA